MSSADQDLKTLLQVFEQVFERIQTFVTSGKLAPATHMVEVTLCATDIFPMLDALGSGANTDVQSRFVPSMEGFACQGPRIECYPGDYTHKIAEALVNVSARLQINDSFHIAWMPYKNCKLKKWNKEDQEI